MYASSSFGPLYFILRLIFSSECFVEVAMVTRKEAMVVYVKTLEWSKNEEDIIYRIIITCTKKLNRRYIFLHEITFCLKSSNLIFHHNLSGVGRPTLYMCRNGIIKWSAGELVWNKFVFGVQKSHPRKILNTTFWWTLFIPLVRVGPISVGITTCLHLLYTISTHIIYFSLEIFILHYVPLEQIYMSSAFAVLMIVWRRKRAHEICWSVVPFVVNKTNGVGRQWNLSSDR